MLFKTKQVFITKQNLTIPIKSKQNIIILNKIITFV